LLSLLSCPSARSLPTTSSVVQRFRVWIHNPLAPACTSTALRLVSEVLFPETKRQSATPYFFFPLFPPLPCVLFFYRREPFSNLSFSREQRLLNVIDVIFFSLSGPIRFPPLPHQKPRPFSLCTAWYRHGLCYLLSPCSPPSFFAFPPPFLPDALETLSNANGFPDGRGRRVLSFCFHLTILPNPGFQNDVKSSSRCCLIFPLFVPSLPGFFQTRGQ